MERGDDGRPDFATFAAAQYRPLVRALSLYCGDLPLAEQIAHEAFVRARERWDQVARMDAPAGWLHRVAVNLSNSWWRRQAAERRAYARAGARPAVHDGDDPADKVAVRDALRALPPRQREVLVLRFFVDLSVAQTAAHLGVTEGAVKALTHRAVGALRRRLVETGVALPEVLHDA